MDKQEKLSRLFLSNLPGVGSKTFKSILEIFPKISDIFSFSKKDFEDRGLQQKIIQKIISHRLNFDPDVEYKNLDNLGIGFKVLGEDKYPKLLSQIDDPPPVIYHCGDYKVEDFEKCIAVVGSRKATEYGKRVTQKFVNGLVEKGFVVVSGLAFGIDSIAHRSAIESKDLFGGGRTIAVLPTSPNEPIPRQNENIYKKILKSGSIISENIANSGTIVPGAFPKRNRIIAGLCIGIIVIEAAKKSGSLITADIAFRENRQVFAVPGNIGSNMSLGTNNLIKTNKAKLVENIEDILIEFGYTNRGDTHEKLINIPDKSYSTDEKKIIDALRVESLTVDHLIKKLEIGIQDLLSCITLLEIEDIIEKRIDGKYYIKL